MSRDEWIGLIKLSPVAERGKTVCGPQRPRADIVDLVHRKMRNACLQWTRCYLQKRRLPYVLPAYTLHATVHNKRLLICISIKHKHLLRYRNHLSQHTFTTDCFHDGLIDWVNCSNQNDESKSEVLDARANDSRGLPVPRRLSFTGCLCYENILVVFWERSFLPCCRAQFPRSHFEAFFRNYGQLTRGNSRTKKVRQKHI